MLVIAVSYWGMNSQTSTVETHLPYQQYMPGNVVQIRQINQRKELITLDKPSFHLPAKTCYPELTADSITTAVATRVQLIQLPLTLLMFAM